MPMMSLASLERGTLRERCQLALRSAVTAGRFAAGAHLNEVELAAAFGVSRATVREALRHLEEDGLAVADRRGMLRVPALDDAAIRELYAVRAALEAFAAETVSALGDRQAALEPLERALESLAAAEGDLALQVEADLAFHLRLCELAGNRTLVRAWRSLEGPVRITIMHAGPERALHNMAAARHRPIVEAIRRGDVVAIRTTMFDHMRQAAERLVRAKGDSG